MQIERICPKCGKHFTVSASRVYHGRGKCCSRDCQYLAARENNQQITLKCAHCGKSFKRDASSIKSEHQFCSRDCAYKGRGVGLVKRIVQKPYNCKRKSPRECPICGANFIYSKSTQKYCSRKCFEVAHRDNMLGERNPSFIDGRAKNKRCYRGDDWEIRRREVYKRDKYTCRVCGKKCRGKEIQAHHIIPYRVSFDNSLSNLVTLCIRCHSKVDMHRSQFPCIYYWRSDLSISCGLGM